MVAGDSPSKLKPPMPKLLGLQCRECGAEYPLQATHVCEMCFGPLDAVYDYASLKKVVTRERIESGPKSIWRYRDLLPVEDSTPVVTLGEGFTPLVKADRLGQELGLRNLYLKNDSMNPTNSFKDRPDQLVQGPRGVGRDQLGALAGLRDHGVRVDRKPGQCRGRVLSAGGARVLRVHPG